MTRRSGFSLLEVLCALLVLGVGLSGITQAITLSLRRSKDAQQQTTAAFLAAGVIDTLRADGYITEGEDEGEFEEPLAQYGWKQSVTETTESGLYDVTVEVLLLSTGEPIYELRTRLFDMPYESPYETLTTETDPDARYTGRETGFERRRARMEAKRR